MKSFSYTEWVFSTEFNVGAITYPENYPLFTSLLVEVTALRSQIWRLCLDGNNKLRHIYFMDTYYQMSKEFNFHPIYKMFLVNYQYYQYASNHYHAPGNGKNTEARNIFFPSYELFAPSCEIIMKIVKYCGKMNKNHEK